MGYDHTHQDSPPRYAAGAAGWDEAGYDAFALRDQLQRWLIASTAATQGARVLELGCGSGALACMLAEYGFDVTAIDACASDIAFARSVAQARGLSVRFEVGEPASWSPPAGGFDVIVDSHLLHRVVGAAERRQLLGRLRAALRPDGEFWTETMALPQRFASTARSRIDERGVVWECVEPAAKPAAAPAEGDSWVASRYIAPTAQSLLDEFEAVGLAPLDWHLAIPVAAGEPAGFRARLKRTGA